WCWMWSSSTTAARTSPTRCWRAWAWWPCGRRARSAPDPGKGGLLMLTLADIGERIAARLEGDGSLVIQGCASLEEAGPGDLSFLADVREMERALASRAGALIVPEGAEGFRVPVLRTDNPRLAFARTLALFEPER